MNTRTDALPTWAIYLKQRRQEVGLSQEELAFRAQVSQSLITKLERGTHNIKNVSLDNIESLAMALNLSLHELLALAEPARNAQSPNYTHHVHEQLIGTGSATSMSADQMIDYLAAKYLHPESKSESVKITEEDGDRIYIDYDLAPKPGDAVLVNVDGIETLMRFYGESSDSYSLSGRKDIRVQAYPKSLVKILGTAIGVVSKAV